MNRTVLTLNNIRDKVKRNEAYVDTAMFDNRGRFRMLKGEVSFVMSDGWMLTIKDGFIWDENSIPWIAQPFFPKSGIYSVPALLHDALYYKQHTTREFADLEFAIWMSVIGISPKQMAYRLLAVDLFGGAWWNRNLYRPTDRCLHNRELVTLE